MFFATIPFLLVPWARENPDKIAAAVLPLESLFAIAIDWGR